MAAPINQVSSLPMEAIQRSVIGREEAMEPGRVAGPKGPGFAEALAGALSGASSSEKQAAEASSRFASGDPEVGIHEVVIAAEKANIAVRYAVTLKNRVIEAYRDLMNTPL